MPRNGDKAKVRFTRPQAVFYILLLSGIAAFFILHSRAALIASGYLLLVAYGMIVGHKILAIFAGLLCHDEETVGEEELRQVRNGMLPTYAILVPLYREAEIVAHTVRSIMALDYPTDRLDVLLLVEEDDPDTLRAVRALSLPGHIRVLMIPAGRPKTKPRACNVGLSHATGEHLVIFDAEDRPDPDQLLKAVAVFRRLPPSLGCLQAKLNFYNRSDSILARCFALEYSAWFDLFLPGLHALRCPIPLGGTSNHFRTEALRRVGGWDSYNVTEDCDLGIELARHGIETRVLDSTTWEECPGTAWSWLKQRSRWMKGYWQTFLVHTRRPAAVAAEIGLCRYLQTLVMVGGHIFTMLVNPVSWAILAVWLFQPWRLFFPESPWTVVPVVLSSFLLGINLLFVAVHGLAGWRRRLSGAWWCALFMPVYWGMISIGAVRGFVQFFWAPHFWDKTVHGHSQAASAEKTAIPAVEARSFSPRPVVLASGSRLGRRALFVLLVLLVAGCLAATLYVPVRMKYREQIRRARISWGGPSAQDRQSVEASWFDDSALAITAKLDADGEVPASLFKFMVFVKVADGEWYQRPVDEYELAGNAVVIRVPLDAGWGAKDSGRPWGPWCLRRVREVGLRVFTEPGFPLRKLRIARTDLVPASAPPPPLTATVARMPAEFHQWQVAEFDVKLSREFRNPFDPNEISLDMRITDPAGKDRLIPAYYHQDYSRELRDGREVLTAVGTPRWRVRFTPEMPGIHRWTLAGVAREGGALGQPPGGSFTATPGVARGFVRADPQDGRFFAFANGDFCYPVCLNIRSPADNLRPRGLDDAYPGADEGTYAYDRFFDEMAASGINLGRIWMSPWFGSIEWARSVPGFHGLGEYNLQNAWRLDYLLEVAERRNLLIEIALHHHGPFQEASGSDSQWQDNPYNRSNGGELDRPAQILTDAWAKQVVKTRLRYLVARYGAYPSLFAWLLWIEVDAVENNPAIQEQWHREMAPWLKDLDMARHPITTEFRTATGTPCVWQIPAIDYVQVAAYTSEKGLLNVLRKRANALTSYGKPSILEEYGGAWNGGDRDAIAQEIHDGLWAGWMLPISASPMAWWWNFIFARNLDRFHAAFAAYIRGEDLRGNDDRCINLPVAGATRMAAMARLGDSRAYAWIYHEGVSNSNGVTRDGVDDAFRRSANPGFDPVNDVAPDIFPPEKGLSLALPEMQDGLYRVELWDTWQGGVSEVREMACVGGVLNVPLPVMTRDLALKVKRVDPGVGP
jgi:hypothetical protein